MGISGLPGFIKKEVGELSTKGYPFKRFKGYTLAIDASFLIYCSVMAIRASGRDFVNSAGMITSHLHGVFLKMIYFLEWEITPIIIFDGKAGSNKSKTLDARREKKKIAEEKLKTMEPDPDNEEYVKQFKQTYRPSKSEIKECKILLDLMGIPYMDAPEEADVLCSWLAQKTDKNGKRYVKGVCSDDSDMLPLGACYLFKGILNFMTESKTVTVINLEKTLKAMNIDMDQFITLCVLLGCDYCDGLTSIGPKTAYDLIKTHGSLDDVITFLRTTKKSLNEEEVTDVTNAYQYFKNAVNDLDKNFVLDEDKLTLSKLQMNELIDFMANKHGFDIFKVQTNVKRLIAAQEKMKIEKKNKSKVHTISREVVPEYTFVNFEDTIEMLPSDQDSSEDEIVKKVSKKKLVLK